MSCSTDQHHITGIVYAHSKHSLCESNISRLCFSNKSRKIFVAGKLSKLWSLAIAPHTTVTLVLKVLALEKHTFTPSGPVLKPRKWKFHGYTCLTWFLEALLSSVCLGNRGNPSGKGCGQSGQRDYLHRARHRANWEKINTWARANQRAWPIVLHEYS